MFKEVVLGALGWDPKGTTKSLGQQGAKEAPLERQSLPLSAGRTMSLGPEAREERNGTLKMDSLGSGRQKPSMMNRESSGDS